MDATQLLVVVDDQLTPEAARADVAQVLETWKHASHPMVRTIHARELLARLREADAESLERRGLVVWARLLGTARADVFEILEALFERYVPALVESELAPDWVTGDGVLALDEGQSHREISSALQAMVSQAGSLQTMRDECRLMRVQQASAARQMTQIDEELRLAAQLQRQFIPKELPEVNGVSFQVLWRPAGYVSGDIYEVIRLDEHHIGVFVADAVGHGVPAALMTMYIKRSMPTKTIDPASPNGYRIVEPCDALAALNADLISQNQVTQTRFCTACYAVIDTRDFTVRYARAGHPLARVLREDGSAQDIAADGGLLGLFENEPFEQVEFQMKPGDRLLIFSDGFEVAFPVPGAKSLASNDYLKHFDRLAEGDPAEAFARFTTKLENQSGSLTPRDDLTLICMSVDAAAQCQVDESTLPERKAA